MLETHAMIDTETLGTGTDAVIVSIGAQLFDRSSLISPSFYHVVKLDGQLEAGAKIDPGTLVWWMKQNDKAREIFTSPHVQRYHINEVLLALNQFLLHNEVKYAWSHGASFDLPLIDAAFKRQQLGSFHVPFRNWRCTRTVYDLAGIDVALYRDPNTAHNALTDATDQARAVVDAFRVMPSF